MDTRITVLLVGSLLMAFPASGGPGAGVPVPVAVPKASGFADGGASAALSFPGNHDFLLAAPSNGWSACGALAFDIPWPAQAPTNAQALVFLMDWDYFWYQTKASDYLRPGTTNRFRFDLSPRSTDWTTRGHQGAWHFRALTAPKRVGIRIFCKAAYTGRCELSNVHALPSQDTGAPFIRRVRVQRNELPCFEKFELACELPDRYTDPFDSSNVWLSATFVRPDGSTNRIDGFYTHGFYRERSQAEERAMPQGAPYWQVRYCPTLEGLHTYTLQVRDRFGMATWGPSSFRATPARKPGFVRVSTADPRCFEFDNGAPFFIIGHNTRSPFDTRVVAKFPWMQRWNQGASAYERYFRDMTAHGENLAEVWTAAWSLGLEWSPRWRGYHGVGQFNMMHAWELDRVVELAETLGLYLNLVIHNHGKFSAFSDEEWGFNPFALKNGGYLDNPEAYFTDPRAIAAFQKLMRYMVARWGYTTHIFAWELFSELDLTGSRWDSKNYLRPEVVDWHRQAGRFLKTIDPNRHLVATHVSGDYNRQNPDLVALPEMDFCPVDAYHGKSDPLHIVTLMKETAAFNRRFRKPVQITEFGGSSHGQDIKHLKESLHAALWASTAIPLAGTPMFWWWHLIEEENFYPMYAAVARFMSGEDRRDPALKAYEPALYHGAYAATNLAVVTLKSPTRATGWLYNRRRFEQIDPLAKPGSLDIAMKFQDMRGPDFNVEFWDTISGTVIARNRLRSDAGELMIPVPPFARDIAFHVRPPDAE
jgi:hypothetical protein